MLFSENQKHSTMMQLKELLGFSSKSPSFQSTPKRLTSNPHRHGSVSESQMEENIIKSEPIITKWNPDSSEYNKITYLFRHHRDEAQEFLNSVENLRQAMHFLIAENSTSNKLILAQKLMQIAMKRLENEFYQILSENRDHLDPESVSAGGSSRGGKSTDHDNNNNNSAFMIDDEVDTDRVSVLAMADLKSIADCMIASGYGKECVKIYKVIRKSIVDETLYRLGTERFKSSRVQRMNWETMEHVIKNWMNAAKTAVNSLFRDEKILCDHVFSRSNTIRESCFSEITKEGAMILFRLPELIANKVKKEPERIFLLMELYEVSSDILLEIEFIFNSSSTSPIKLQAQTSLSKLGNSIQSILSEFESNIQRDNSKTPVLGGGIHPSTRSAMNYISSLGDYAAILSDILSNHHPQSSSNSYTHTQTMSPAADQDQEPPLQSSASTQLTWLILVLLCKLDRKAESYKDASLSYLFLANNLHFIVKKVCSTNLKSVLGDDWISNHVNKIKTYASSCESMAWNKALSCLPAPDNNRSGNMLQDVYLRTELLKESMRRFNAAFEEACKRQSSWTVDDGKLRDELKVSIAKKILPRYQEFYNEYLEMVMNNGSDDQDDAFKMVLRFSPDDLGNCLSDLFHGISSSASFGSSSSSSHSSQGCLSISLSP